LALQGATHFLSAFGAHSLRSYWLSGLSVMIYLFLAFWADLALYGTFGSLGHTTNRTRLTHAHHPFGNLVGFLFVRIARLVYG
jgi:hypothetical protein